jgi:threonine/homoserine/homoserine lactone efflux protein
VFVQGFLTNVLNPKVALFFLAFLPQFVDLDAPNKPLAFLFLGTIFNFNGTLCNLFVAWSTASVTGRLGRSTQVTRWLNRCIGGFFIFLGIKLAFARAN